MPEFVRGFAEARRGRIEFSDHGPIARGQMALEDEHIARGRRLLIQDTDLLSTVVYCRHYFGACPPWIEAKARGASTGPVSPLRAGHPWVADGVRDRGHMRAEMHELFRAALIASGAPTVTVRGDREARSLLATQAVDGLLGTALHPTGS